METRRLGRTGLDVSLLTFGCGAVGGLMTRGDPADQDRAVAWARERGITHFDTAPLYGDGASETNLGRALGGNRDGLVISTKVMLRDADRDDFAGAVARSTETSLRRLGLDHVDLLQLHNRIELAPTPGAVSPETVLNEILPALEAQREAGRARFLGFTANGDPEALLALTQSDRFDAAQVFYNLLAPTAGEAVPPGYPCVDYRGLLHEALAHGVGTIGVRVLAGGALSGREARHPLGMPLVAPIGSGRDYAEDGARARRFQPLVDEGVAADLPELAIRYVVSNAALSTTEIGVATLAELQAAADAVDAGPLPDAALARIDEIRAGFATA